MTMKHGGLAMVVGLALAASGCSRKVELFCDENTPCEDPAVPFCDLNGEFEASEGITNTCIPDPFAGADAGLDAAPLDCEADTTVCESDQTIVCGPDGIAESVEDCPLGCHDTEPRCNKLDPANGLAPQLDDAAGGIDLVLTDGATINTSTGEVRNGDGSVVTVANELLGAPNGGVAVRVFKVASMTTGDVTIVGDPAIAIVSNAEIEIDGAFLLDPNAAPGRFPAGSACDGATGIGGSGGGFGAPGGDGKIFQGGLFAGGQVSGGAALEPLRGGCQGGEYVGSIARGGGAIQLVSRTRISIGSSGGVGSVSAPGRGGDAAPPPGPGVLCSLANPIGGGGSGGGILIEAPAVEFGADSGASANGGGGGCNCTASGSSGLFSVSPAPSGCGSVVTGNGGSRLAPAGNASGGTGGGGGVGRIRIHTGDGSFSPNASAIVSPMATVSGVRRR